MSIETEFVKFSFAKKDLIGNYLYVVRSTFSLPFRCHYNARIAGIAYHTVLSNLNPLKMMCLQQC
jgi:hypothetical protein